MLEKKKLAGNVEAISVSNKKGVRKENVKQARVIHNVGIENDAHAAVDSDRQVSLLAIESFEIIKRKLPGITPGAFGENITTKGINLTSLSVGAQLKVGKEVLLEISKIGKECHSPCYIFHTVGECIMPKEGIFARVIDGGIISVGDRICVE